MEGLEIVGLTGIGAILLTYILLLIKDYRDDCKDRRELAERDREWKASPDYIPPPKPPLATRNPSIRIRW